MKVHQILTKQSATITDLKQDPISIAQSCKQGAIAILNRNQPIFYCVTPAMFKYFLELSEDAEFGKIAQERMKQGEFIAINIDDL